MCLSPARALLRCSGVIGSWGRCGVHDGDGPRFVSGYCNHWAAAVCPKFQSSSPPPSHSRITIIALAYMQVDAVSAELLELQRLSYCTALQYAPSRNRQYQLYAATERPDARR
jgi:hypothetical protein